MASEIDPGENLLREPPFHVCLIGSGVGARKTQLDQQALEGVLGIKRRYAFQRRPVPRIERLFDRVVFRPPYQIQANLGYSWTTRRNASTSTCTPFCGETAPA